MIDRCKNSLKIPKGVMRSRKSKYRQYNGQKKKTTRKQTMSYKTLLRKLKIEQHDLILQKNIVDDPRCSGRVQNVFPTPVQIRIYVCTIYSVLYTVKSLATKDTKGRVRLNKS